MFRPAAWVSLPVRIPTRHYTVTDGTIKVHASSTSRRRMNTRRSPSPSGTRGTCNNRSVILIAWWWRGKERDFLELDRRLSLAAKNHIKDYPFIQVRNVMAHLAALWRRPAAWSSTMAPPLKLAWFGAYLAFLMLSVLGIFTAWRTKKLGVIPLNWLILIACHTTLLLPICTEPRYQATPAIFLYIFAGLGVAAILPFPVLCATTTIGIRTHVQQISDSRFAPSIPSKNATHDETASEATP